MHSQSLVTCEDKSTDSTDYINNILSSLNLPPETVEQNDIQLALAQGYPFYASILLERANTFNIKIDYSLQDDKRRTLLIMAFVCKPNYIELIRLIFLATYKQDPELLNKTDIHGKTARDYAEKASSLRIPLHLVYDRLLKKAKGNLLEKCRITPATVGAAIKENVELKSATSSSVLGEQLKDLLVKNTPEEKIKSWWEKNIKVEDFNFDLAKNLMTALC